MKIFTYHAGSIASAVQYLARCILAEDENWLSELRVSQNCDSQEVIKNQQLGKLD